MGCKSSREVRTRRRTDDGSECSSAVSSLSSFEELEDGALHNYSFEATPQEILDHDKEAVSAFMHLREWAESQDDCQVIETTARKASENEFLELTHFALHLPCEVELMPTDDAPPFVVDRVKFINTVRHIVDHVDVHHHHHHHHHHQSDLHQHHHIHELHHPQPSL